jgi:hypothetical protein
MTTYTPTELIETLQKRMKGNEGKGSSLGTLRATNDPEKQHLIGVPQFLEYGMLAPLGRHRSNGAR